MENETVQKIMTQIDINTLCAIGAMLITTVGLIYAFLRNFKEDINKKLDHMEKRIDDLEARMFWLATGKRLEDAILEEKMKRTANENR